jgi:SAM-dependent methyltransferase
MNAHPPDDALPVPDPRAAGAVRELLGRADYNEPALRALIGTHHPEAMWARFRDRTRILDKTDGDAPLAVLARLFLIGEPVSRSRAESALAPLGVEGAIAAGLLLDRPGDDVEAAIKLAPFEGLMLAADRVWRSGMRPDHVLGAGSNPRSLAHSIIRRPVARVLDLGTGGGVLAFLSARHADRVIGLDISRRALDFARFNAALNEAENVEFREGDLFTPVAGERFDLIIANPPYVVSPSSILVYRDGGLVADGFCEKVVRGLPEHLEEGGFAQLLINWAVMKGQDWRERIGSWVVGSGCDVWLIRSKTYEPDVYTSLWVGSEGTNPQEEYGRWMDYYREQGIEAIGAGSLTLRKRTAKGGRENWFRIDDEPEAMGPPGVSIAQGFAGRDCSERGDEELLGARLVPSPHLRVEQVARPAQGEWEIETWRLRLVEGYSWTAALDHPSFRMIQLLQPDHTLAEVSERLAAELDLPSDVARAGVLALARVWLDYGLIMTPDHLKVAGTPAAIEARAAEHEPV